MRHAAILCALVVLGACASRAPAGPIGQAPGNTPDTARVPLTELGTATYLGFQGGLYPGGSNVLPAALMASSALGFTQRKELSPSGLSALGMLVERYELRTSPCGSR